ncbi:GNAT family N-acetyltransferase [Inquilinus sp. Marseille-Q2685]|uniref:GNAT family N-acetyltransferase n=1 Tax=Inquilinus sp. Marseille-Q2685 TaxID=2866581 RepID=UPI001CE3EADB|nr:GNAT family N-acetyltransferase [Inquilinus sp. Marseille-Q2685]
MAEGLDPRKRRTIEVVDYDPAWPALFDEIRAGLEQLLEGLVLEIHHIGSTAVPGLCAKPKIDIDIVLHSAAAIPEAIERMQATGDYIYHGDKYRDGMWTFTTGRGSRGLRLYLCAPSTATHLRRLLFRDHLRCHPEAAVAYGALKRKLVSETADDWDYYTGSKGPFVAGTERRALAERIESVISGRDEICRAIVEDLPEWFGIPAAREAYITAATALPMLACIAPDGSALGFASVQVLTAAAAEIHVLGVRRDWHRCGIDRALVDAADRFAAGQGCRYLTVKTLSPARPGPAYEATRRFYDAVGFVPIEELPMLWGPDNPCLLMLRPVRSPAGSQEQSDV